MMQEMSPPPPLWTPNEWLLDLSTKMGQPVRALHTHIYRIHTCGSSPLPKYSSSPLGSLSSLYRSRKRRESSHYMEKVTRPFQRHIKTTASPVSSPPRLSELSSWPELVSSLCSLWPSAQSHSPLCWPQYLGKKQTQITTECLGPINLKRLMMQITALWCINKNVWILLHWSVKLTIYINWK